MKCMYIIIQCNVLVSFSFMCYVSCMWYASLSIKDNRYFEQGYTSSANDGLALCLIGKKNIFWKKLWDGARSSYYKKILWVVETLCIFQWLRLICYREDFTRIRNSKIIYKIQVKFTIAYPDKNPHCNKINLSLSHFTCLCLCQFWQTLEKSIVFQSRIAIYLKCSPPSPCPVPFKL